MKLYWSARHNFGDSLNPWLWEKLLPGAFDQDSSEMLVGIGTLLNHKLPRTGHKHVFGSGYGYGCAPDVHTSDWTIYCVRGPLTAARLNIAADLAVTDPAVLIRRFVTPTSHRSNEIIFIPHFESLGVGEWETVCRLANLAFVNPCDTIENVIQRIRAAKLVVAEAMHGAIVADALRVPWVPIRPLIRKNEYKWFDWFGSLGLACKPYALPPSSICEAIKVRYNIFREFAKRELCRRDLADLFSDRTPINETFQGETLTQVPGRSVGDRLRTLSDRMVPAFGSMIAAPIRGPLDRMLRDEAVEALASAAEREPYLSPDDVIEDLTQRLEEKLTFLRRYIETRCNPAQPKQIAKAELDGADQQGDFRSPIRRSL